MSARQDSNGDSWIWITGGAVAVSLLLIVGIFGLIPFNGMAFFWPKSVVELELIAGEKVYGEVVEQGSYVKGEGLANIDRLKRKRGNRDLYGQDFVWLDEYNIAAKSEPQEVLVIERMEWGNFYGRALRVLDQGKILAQGYSESLALIEEKLPAAAKLRARILQIERDEIGAINFAQEKLRLELKGAELSGVHDQARFAEIRRKQEQLSTEFVALEKELSDLRSTQTVSLVCADAQGVEKEILLVDILRVFEPNRMGFFSKLGSYFVRIWEFVAGSPREANTEGGIWPALFGTVMMVFIMSIAVTPLGVIAAIYLREYAKQGVLVSIGRIAVNNLAGVPSIVFGVFGVGFFIYFLGGSIDALFYPEALPTPTFGTGEILWSSLTLALLTVPTVIVATEEGLAAIPNHWRQGGLCIGATKDETVSRVVIPALLPAILTGVILAIARAAGEVAPLMITGVVKLAPSMPLDTFAPFLHFDRKFMHLGFHIYDLGFQSPNVDAAQPMLFATTLLLLLLVLGLNLIAVFARNRLQRKLSGSAL